MEYVREGERKNWNGKEEEERKKSQLPNTGSVIGSACFADGFAEELVI
jgi:hypothetical protein